MVCVAEALLELIVTCNVTGDTCMVKITLLPIKMDKHFSADET